MPTLQFKGKNIIWNHHLSVPYHTLQEREGLSYLPEKTRDNLIIEGDNLLALKALLPKYSGRVKCAYIDPPYNTGKEEWVYNDNVNSPLMKAWFKQVIDNEDLTKHDKWLCMMTPRLKLLRTLLKDDGVLFISIDDNELHHLKTLMDEIFGEGNFLGNIIWHTATDNNVAQISTEHEYILCYAKDVSNLHAWEIPSEKGKRIQEKYRELADQYGAETEKIQYNLRKWIREASKNGTDLSGVAHYSYVDKKGVFYPGNSANTKPGGYDYDILHPVTQKKCKKPKNGFRWPKATFLKADKRNDVMWGADEQVIPKIKKRLHTATEILKSYHYEDNRANTQQLKTLFQGKKVFDNPKSIHLLKKLIRYSTSKDDLILDSFAGSGSTMHAMMDLNKEDEGNRNCILIQMPEDNTADPKENITQHITRERIKRAIQQYGYNTGFSYAKIGTPISPETLLDGKLPSWDQFAEYVFFLCTGHYLQDKSQTKPNKWYIGGMGASSVYLIYTPDFDQLTGLALNLDLAEQINEHAPGTKKIIYAPACFLDEEYMNANQIEFVGIPYHLFHNKTE